MENDAKEQIRQKQAALFARVGHNAPEGDLVDYDEYGIPNVPENQPPTPPPPPHDVRGPGQRPPQPRPTQRPEPLEKYQHPVVSKLLGKFGLKKEKRYPLEVTTDQASFKFLMVPIPDELSLWAVQKGQDLSAQEGLQIGTGWLQTLLMACSVVAMDETPVYEVWGLTPSDEEAAVLRRDPYDISNRLIKLSATALAKLLWSRLPMVTDRLDKFYKEVVSPSIKVESTYEREQKELKGNLCRFLCPIDKCTYEFTEVPVTAEGGGTAPLFCKLHGTTMVNVSSLKEESDFPLA